MRFIVGLFLLSRVFAQPLDINTDRLRADLFFLAAPALEGRNTLTRGAETTAEWLVSEFTKIGLKPVNGTSFRQRVPITEFRLDREASVLTMRLNGKEQIWRAPAATANFFRDFESNAPVVFAGYGVTAPEYKYDDYAGLDVRGKIVLVLAGEPQEADAISVFNGKGLTRHANAWAKARTAQQHGAVAVILINKPGGDRPERTGGGAQRAERPLRQALTEGGAEIPTVTVSSTIGDALLASSGKTSADLRTAIDANLKPVPVPLPGLESDVRIVLSESRRAWSANIVGMIEGSDPKLKEETIMVSAHYDHVGTDGGLHPGADDDGSGTVGVVELARAFASAAVKPKRTLVFALFTGEEKGLLGSHYYASRPMRPLDKTRFLVNLDMIGRNEAEIPATKGKVEISADTSNEVGIIGTVFSPGSKALVERANSTVGLRLDYKWDSDSTQNLLFRSDQFPFLARNVPVMFWTTGLHPDYHQVTDTADKINYGKMTRILKLAGATMTELANMEKPPAIQ